MTTPVRIVLLYWQAAENATLSYQHGWPRAFMASAAFECTSINLAFTGWADRLQLLRTLAAGRFDAIVMLHSVFSNQLRLRRLLFWLVARCPQPKAFFIGNEYKLMPEKIRFCRDLGLDLLISQSNDPRVLALYREAVGCAVVSVPNTGCDLSVFYPTTALADRPIDIGYRSLEAPPYLGNNEKVEIAECFLARVAESALRLDISLAQEDRFDEQGYAAFLNRCRGQIGTESGGEYFELTDHLRLRVVDYLKQNPQAAWADIKVRFFDGTPPGIPMRIISGRQVEAAACKTVQILFEGRYNGYLQPDEHYIPLAKDFGNFDEAMRKFRDDTYCARLVDNAFNLAAQELTYEKLIDKFRAGLAQVI